ncbi:hypothetical protein B296_00002809 [Ensete ventricosum]|uniref:Uncharacterized protein n=1 Tax=Ensete ventricosum TaxID=4639 RepID=A0A427ACK0_ENSVE|nr:hypothetical protein B296_00002809 [Ensete ventricosum]
MDRDNGAPILVKSGDFRSYYAMDYPRAMLRLGVTQEWGGTKVNCQGSEPKIGDGGGPTMSAGELDYFSAHIRLREPGKSEDMAELMQECLTKERSRQYAVLYLFYSEE